jgi:spoIIIJ-associated protein
MSENVERSLNVNAKTIDEAIEQGLAQLGLPRDQVEIEIIKEGKRGVFGLGSEDAQVRLTPRGAASIETSEQVESSTPESVAEISEPAPSPEPAHQLQLWLKINQKT